MSEKANRIFWILLLCAAFAVRAGVAIYWDAHVRSVAPESDHALGSNANPVANSESAAFFFGDSDSYWKLGRAIAYGRPYEFDPERRWQIFRTPGYPAILAPLFWICGENPPTLLARFQGVFFGVLNVALVGLLAAKLLAFPYLRKRLLPLLAGIVVAFDPTLVFQSVLILSEESFLTFALLQFLLAVELARKLGALPFPVRDLRALESEQPRLEWRTPRKLSLFSLFVSAALLGLATAATIYIRPSWYYFLPFATAIVLGYRFLIGNPHELEDCRYTPYEIFFSWKKTIFTAAVTTFFVFIALEPWIARNYRLTGRFIPTTLQMGASLYDGLSPTATGASDMRFVDEFRQKELESPSGQGEHFEVRLDERMKQASLEWTKTHPKEAAKLALIKIYRLWAPLPREKAFAKPVYQIALFISFTPVFVLGVVGGYISLKRKGAAWILLVPSVYITALHSIFVSSIRYRTPVLFGFAILAAYVVVICATKIRQKRAKS